MKTIDANTGFLIHRIQPYEKEDRVNFQILVPFDCGCITAICALAIPSKGAITEIIPSPMKYANHAGKLSFRLREVGDIFYQAIVPSVVLWDDNYMIAGIPNPEKLTQGRPYPWISGSQFQETEIQIGTDHKSILGYYVDELNKVSMVKEKYTVDIILRYQKKP